MKETKLTEPEKASIYGKFQRIKEERTKPIGYHLIGDMISDAQDAKTKRVIWEWLETKSYKTQSDINPNYQYRFLTEDNYEEFKKWALGE